MGSPLQNGHNTPAPPATNEPPATTSTPAAAAPSTQQPAQTQTNPLSSLQDDGTSKRPRDARLIHLVLSSLGIQSYQERVPLQLLDFAYRYSSGILSDSLRLSAEGYTNAGTNDRGGKRGGGGGGGGGGAAGDGAAGGGEKITVTSLRQAIASRQGYSFEGGGLPKEVLLEQAQKRNAVALPLMDRSAGGALQLPKEEDCLTGVGWGLKDLWSEDESVGDADEVGGARDGELANGRGSSEDQRMGGMDGDDDDGVEEGGGRMEDVFGEEGDDTGMQG